jgi:hypothetical protein
MRYFYFRIYQHLKKVKTNDTPALNAMLLLALWQGLTLESLISLIVKVNLTKQETIFQAIILAVVVLILDYQLIYRKREVIYKQYKLETLQERKKGTTVLLAYIIGTVLLFIIGEI